jgi:hypothetical protein
MMCSQVICDSYYLLLFGQNWNMSQRTILEDELAKYSTPMYRAPEMLGRIFVEKRTGRC